MPEDWRQAPPDGVLAFPFLVARARHPRLPAPIELLVPQSSANRPVSAAFLSGAYWERLTHTAFLAITSRAPKRSVVHGGCFFGDMLHTLSLHSEAVFAFEPAFENYAFAKRNADRLGLRNVLLFNAGLGDVTATMPLRYTDADGNQLGGVSRFSDKPDASGCAFEFVPVLRLDDLPIRDLGLLHLDVEGSQLAALRGAEATIRRDRPIILVEDPRELASPFLAEIGYRKRGDCASLSYWGTEADAAFLDDLLGRLQPRRPNR